MSLLPGMPGPPNPDATKNCSRHCVSGLVERDDGSFYPCPQHRPKAFEKWTKGGFPGWTEITETGHRLTEPRKATL